MRTVIPRCTRAVSIHLSPQFLSMPESPFRIFRSVLGRYRAHRECRRIIEIAIILLLPSDMREGEWHSGTPDSKSIVDPRISIKDK